MVSGRNQTQDIDTWITYLWRSSSDLILHQITKYNSNIYIGWKNAYHGFSIERE